MTVRPTGRHERLDGVDLLVLERGFDAPAEEVWAAVTRPERLERWIGTWDGDPATGSVQFRMTAEAQDAEPQDYRIDACRPPEHVRVHSEDDYGVWDIELRVAVVDGVTTLTFVQVVHDPSSIPDIGPGWEYYLDRLVAAETGEDVAAVDFDDYHQPLGDHYRGLAVAMATPDPPPSAG